MQGVLREIRVWNGPAGCTGWTGCGLGCTEPTRMQPFWWGPVRAGWADSMVRTDILPPDRMAIYPEQLRFLLMWVVYAEGLIDEEEYLPHVENPQSSPCQIPPISQLLTFWTHCILNLSTSRITTWRNIASMNMSPNYPGSLVTLES